MNPNEFEIQQYIDRIKELQTALRFQQEVMRARRDRKIVKPTDTLWRVYPCGCRAAGDPPAVCPNHSPIDYTITHDDRLLLEVIGTSVSGKTWRD